MGVFRLIVHDYKKTFIARSGLANHPEICFNEYDKTYSNRRDYL